MLKSIPIKNQFNLCFDPFGLRNHSAFPLWNYSKHYLPSPPYAFTLCRKVWEKANFTTLPFQQKSSLLLREAAAGKVAVNFCPKLLLVLQLKTLPSQQGCGKGAAAKVKTTTKQKSCGKSKSKNPITREARSCNKTIGKISKANLIQTLLLLTKLKTKRKSLFKKLAIKNNSYHFGKPDESKAIPQKILKPFSTVTGFKKFMYNFVKISQNQLQPSYNRRKSNHSHYNQILKESTRLSHIYAYLSRPQMKAYCAFSIKPTPSLQYSPLLLLRGLLTCEATKNLYSPLPSSLYLCEKSKGKRTEEVPLNSLAPLSSQEVIAKSCAQLNDYVKPAAPKPSMSYSRPIPKVVNFLESRLDVIFWRNQLANSIRAARQKLRQGIQVNGSLQKKSSFQALPGDVFSF